MSREEKCTTITYDNYGKLVTLETSYPGVYRRTKAKLDKYKVEYTEETSKSLYTLTFPIEAARTPDTVIKHKRNAKVSADPQKEQEDSGNSLPSCNL